MRRTLCAVALKMVLFAHRHLTVARDGDFAVLPDGADGGALECHLCLPPIRCTGLCRDAVPSTPSVCLRQPPPSGREALRICFHSAQKLLLSRISASAVSSLRKPTEGVRFLIITRRPDFEQGGVRGVSFEASGRNRRPADCCGWPRWYPARAPRRGHNAPACCGCAFRRNQSGRNWRSSAGNRPSRRKHGAPARR